MSWGKRTILGVEYDLTHLDSHVIAVPGKTRTHRVRVSYGCHCFARELLPGDHRDLHFPDNGNIRCFSPTRAIQSKRLRGIVQAAVGGVAYFSQGRNMVLVQRMTGGPYAVFFNLAKAKRKDIDVVMFVASAYPKPALPKKLHAISSPVKKL
jgi:hypothetical protein